MVNRRPDPVSYRRFDAQPQPAEGLLSVSRDNGDLERKVAAGMARMADEFAQRADRAAARAGAAAGARDARARAPTGATTTRTPAPAAAVPDGAIRIAPRAGNDRAAYARDYLVKKHGLSPHAAAAVAGHGMQESGFNAAAVGDSGTAFGSFQWRGERWQNLQRFARERGADPGNLDTELDFVMHEMGTTERRAGQALAAARNIDEAVEGFMHFERPAGYSTANPRGGHAFDNRLAFARGLAGAGSGGGEGGYARLPSAASVAPVSVTPVRDEVSIAPGQAGSWRPGGRDTVYGRAYDVAGTRTYLEMVDMAMEQNQAAVFEKYAEDPAMLRKALDEGLVDDLRGNVFEEIAPEYTAAYRRRAAALVSRADAEAQKRRQMQNRVEFLGRVEQLENSKSQRLAGLDPSDPAAGPALQDLQSSIDAHWDSAAARGIIDLDKAESYKRKSRDELTTGFYVGQAATMSADDIATMRAEMTKDYAEGRLSGVSAEAWSEIDRSLAASHKARQQQDEKAIEDLARRGDALAKRVAQGDRVSPEELVRYQLDGGSTPRGREIVTSFLARMRVSDAIRTQTPDAVERGLSELLGESATSADREFAQKAIAEHRKDIATDPLGVAERFGILPLSASLPLGEDAGTSSVAGAFSDRITSARAAARYFGVSPRFFRPGEAKAIEEAVVADPQRGLDIAAGLVGAAGDDADAVLRELGDSAPAVALAGGLIASGGNRQAGLDLIAGFGKAPDGKKFADIPTIERKPLAERTVGKALMASPAEIDRLDQAAAAIARKRIYDTGLDPKEDGEVRDIYRRAYQEAAGAAFSGGVQFGGFTDYSAGWFGLSGKVWVPPSIRADRLSDIVGEITDAEVGKLRAQNGQPLTAREFRRAMPVAVKGGYAFSLGDIYGVPMWIADESGQPVVVDLERLRPVLEPRVPGAYR